MISNKTPRQNRVREALGRIYDQHPPHFREYLERFKEDPTSRIFAPLAEAYRRMGKVEEAIEICKKGLEHHSDFHGGRVALAKCYIDEKNFEAAKRELELVVANVPENLLAQRLLGDMHLALDNKPAAIHAYKMALLLSPADVALSEKVYGLEKSLEELPVEKVQQKAADYSPQEAVVAAETEEMQSSASSSPETSIEEDDEEDNFVVSVPVMATHEEEIESDPRVKSEIHSLIGLSDEEAEQDSFRVLHFGAAFSEEEKELHREITTGTLGDLYYQQQQYQNALEIFERLYRDTKSADILKKIHLCQSKLGMDRSSLVRNRQIETLRTILRNKELLRTG